MNQTARIVLLVVLVLVVVPLLWGTMMMGGPGVWMGPGMGPGMMRGWGWDEGWSPWRAGLAMLPMVVGLVAVGGAVLWATGAFGRPSSSSDAAQPNARQLLDTRYAKGEITREQYQQMRGDLES